MTDQSIPRPRPGEPDPDPIEHLNWWQLRAKELKHLKREKLRLLLQAEESRNEAIIRREQLIDLWRREQRAVGTPQALKDADDKRVYTAYGGKRATDDPVWKSLMSDHASCLTRASAVATVEIALRLEIENELSSRRRDQNDEILDQLKYVSGFLRGQCDPPVT